MRNHGNGRFPHEGVYARLGASPIHGVGVFAIKDIPKGTYIFPDDDDELIWIDIRTLEKLSQDERKLYDDFCIIHGNLYGCPRSFNKLTPAWYFNESREPNVAVDKEYRFFARRRIKRGEELTVNYDSYSDRPPNA
jgi:SET domain-containing protein